MAIDIGVFLFKEILQMMEYPASPFTGVIINDLVMFFLIPTIFIILVIYMAVGRVVAGHPGLRLLVGLGSYLFIIFGGYFGVFARFAGPYFLFLIFGLGLIYFILEHFSRRGGYSSGGGFSGGSGGGGYEASSPFKQMTTHELQIMIRNAENAMKDSSTKDKGAVMQQLIMMESEARSRGLQIAREVEKVTDRFKVPSKR
ncbi:MAG: hypothetical protein HY831_00640 [Candidatus Aenigmarchaeota archaeon]|nr:hypothetical protein [Candidatus Aenigmarchaeota archaeon]